MGEDKKTIRHLLKVLAGSYIVSFYQFFPQGRPGRTSQGRRGPERKQGLARRGGLPLLKNG